MIAYHPRNRSNDLAARSRFTGEILVAASLALILVWSVLGLLGAVTSPWAGAGDAFGRIELWLFAALAGLLFRAPGTWLGFWTINRTGVQTYLIALTAMPFFAIALEAAAAWLGCGILGGIAGLLLADLVALDATTLTFLVISSLAAVLIARLRSITVTFVAAIVIGLLHDLLTPIASLTSYRDMTPFVIAAIGLLVLSRHQVMTQSREEA